MQELIYKCIRCAEMPKVYKEAKVEALRSSIGGSPLHFESWPGLPLMNWKEEKEIVLRIAITLKDRQTFSQLPTFIDEQCHFICARAGHCARVDAIITGTGCD